MVEETYLDLLCLQVNKNHASQTDLLDIALLKILGGIPKEKAQYMLYDMDQSAVLFS